MSQITSVETLFFAALERKSPEERRAFLDEACAGDPELRLRVERLLEAHPKISQFLQTPATTAAGADREELGTLIGPYKLLQVIGEGGMGTVYLAEQIEPVRRMVAIKIIKAGMDSAQVIARFEAERQALALMDHPNIAKVLDAGTTEAGAPYFVMELVKGVPITMFCDENQLSIPQRLTLFVPVCQAIQHAHQKGIIHRDLKPSNVLVTLYDDRPVPKVIDFGVAKATNQRLTERTLFTEFGSVVGTLEYMSPEQARLNALDIDTRSDIYALGILLYELLTGSTPLNHGRIQQAAIDEVLRLIREEEPQKPSTRLSRSGEARATISSHRRSEPSALDRLLRGDLDWIVMKCLEKDRARRYESASGLARDIERHLADEPVEARPPTAGYRLRKFARKHRPQFIAAAVCGAAVVLGMVGAIGGYIRAVRAEALARAEAQRAHAEARRANQAQADAQDQAKRAATAAEATRTINRFLEAEVFDIYAPFRDRDGGKRFRAFLDRVSRTLDREYADRPQVEAGLRRLLGAAYLKLADARTALPHLKRSEELYRSHLGAEDTETLRALAWLASCLSSLNDPEMMKLEPALVRGLELVRERVGWGDPLTIDLSFVVAGLAVQNGRIDEAERLDREALEEGRRALGSDNAHLIDPLYHLAFVLSVRAMREPAGSSQQSAALERWKDAARAAVDETTRLVGDHPATTGALDLLVNAELLSGPNRLPAAEALAERNLEMSRRVQGSDHPQTTTRRAVLAYIRLKLNKPLDAETLIRECLKATDQQLVWPWQQHAHRAVLGECLRAQGKHAEAEPLLIDGFTRFQASANELPPTYRFLIPEMMSWIVRLYDEWGKPEKAKEWMEKLKAILPPNAG